MEADGRGRYHNRVTKLLNKTVYIQTIMDETPWMCTVLGTINEMENNYYSVETEDGTRILVDADSVVTITAVKKAKVVKLPRQKPRLLK